MPRGDREFNLEGNNSSEDEGELRSLPPGVLRIRKGWEGETLELDHTLKHDEHDEVENTTLKSQFQNTDIGEGYLHKGVKRQRSVGESNSSSKSNIHTSKIIDMTKKEGGVTSTSNESEHTYKLTHHTKVCRKEELQGMKNNEEALKRSFLKNERMRDFKREICKIIASGE